MSLCVSCHNPLILTLPPSDHASLSSSSTTIPDDVQLRCACHFHWQCLLDAYNITRCPNCDQSISSTRQGAQQGQEVVLVTLHNEGGLQHNIDILPLLVEESYLKAYPEERKARAFLEFVREGDIEAVVDLIKASSQNDEDEDEDESMDEDRDGDSDEDSEDGPQMSVAEILRYQDPLDEGRSALHIAAEKGNGEIVWLMLLLASGLEVERFPEQVRLAAVRLGVEGESQEGLRDVRGVRDAGGRTAYDLVVQEGMSGFDVALLRPP